MIKATANVEPGSRNNKVPIRKSFKYLGPLFQDTNNILFVDPNSPVVDVSLSAEFNRQVIVGDVRAALLSSSNTYSIFFIEERRFNTTVLQP